MKPLIAKIVGMTVLANVLLVFFLVGGAISGAGLVREGVPEISVNTILVEIAYPGADPYEAEEGISRKVEEAIDGLEGVKRYTTVSIENASRSVIEINESYPMDKALDNVRNAIDSISSFPVDAEQPVVSEVTIRSEVIFVALWGDITERVGKELAEQLKDELQALPEISQVSVSGVRDYEIAIEISEEKLRQYGLSFDQVTDTIRSGSVNLSGGTLRTKGEKVEIKAQGRKYTGEEFADIVVLARPDGDIITLDQVATIRDSFTEDEVIARFNGHPCVMIGVFKTSDEDAIAVAQATKDYVAETAPTLPDGIELTAWNDTSQQIESQINILLKNGVFGLIIVIVMLWLFMDTRLSFWVAMGIPISISGALIILGLAGGSLNVMTLLGLILVMGIIVDDAIVVGEAIYTRRTQGDQGVAAAAHGVMEVGLPVIAAVTTTIIAFVPLFFIPSVVGKFVSFVPVVVIAALAVSIIEALFLLPAHLNHLPDPRRPIESFPWFLRGGIWLRANISKGLKKFIERVYRPTVRLAVSYRYVTLAAAVAFLMITMGGLLGGGIVKFILFPELDSPFIESTIEFPQGTPIEVTKRAVAHTEEALYDMAAELEEQGEPKLVYYVYSVIGQGGDIFEARDSGPHFGVVRVQVNPNADRTYPARELLAMWEERTGKIPGTIAQNFQTQEQGPPGAPIQVWLKGRDTDELKTAATKLKRKLESYGGLYQVQDDYREGSLEIRVDVKPEARALGITLDDLAQQVYSGFFGEEAIRIQRGRDDIRVKVRYATEGRDTLADLEQVRIRTADGHEVPFFSVAEVEFGRSVSSVTRVDGIRTIAVSAEVNEARANAEEVLADLSAGYMDELTAEFPGVAWSFEGAKQDSNEAFGSIMIGFPMAMFGIFVIVATVFRSYLQPFVILLTVPFGVTGAIYGHLLMGMPLMLFSVFGMVALAGVVVNDSIVLIEAVNSRIAQGMYVFEAICDGGARRFRAILLTTISTSGGLAPLILETDFSAKFLIPMALSVASGVFVATIFTLLLIPSLLMILSDFRILFVRIFKGHWPTREEVEPARVRNIDRYKEDVSTASGAPAPAK